MLVNIVKRIHPCTLEMF